MHKANLLGFASHCTRKDGYIAIARFGAEGQAAGREEFEIASKHDFPMWQATGQF